MQSSSTEEVVLLLVKLDCSALLFLVKRTDFTEMLQYLSWNCPSRCIIVQMFLPHNLAKLLKDLQIQDTHYTTYKILYDTTNTIPRGARYHVYPVALGRRKKEKRQDYIEQYSKRKFTKKGDLAAALKSLTLKKFLTQLIQMCCFEILTHLRYGQAQWPLENQSI